MNRFYKLCRPWVVLALSCLLLGACSSGFLYRHLDWLLIRFVEGYVDELNPAQQRLIRADVVRLSAALEHDLLPDMQALLERLAEDNRQGRMGGQLDHYLQALATLYNRAVRLAEPGITTLALTLDNRQKNQLFDELARRNKKFYRKYLAKGEAHAREKHLRSLRKNVRKWLGKTSSSQNVALQKYDAHYRANEQGWLDSRKRWQLALQQALDADEVAVRRRQLRDLLLRPRQHWTSDYLAIAEHNRQVSLALTRALAADMTAPQRRRFDSELNRNRDKVADFAQAIAAIKARQIAGRQSAPNVATAAPPAAGQLHRAYSR